MAESNPFVAYPPVGYPNRFKMAVIALLAVVAGVGLILLLRFFYPGRVCVRWEPRVVAHEGGPHTTLICAEYRDAASDR